MAVAALLTFGVAVVAAIYAKRQIDDARAARREEAQPYVVVYAEVTPDKPHFADVVIRNLGKTGASNIRLTCTPELQRSARGGQGIEPVPFPTSLIFLAPGQEWRTLWDFGPDHARAQGIVDRYEVTAAYTDYLGKEHSTPSVLDWAFFRERVWVSNKTVHEAAEALDRIAGVLKSWAQRNDVVKVATYDGAAYDQRVAEGEQRHRDAMREFARQVEESRRPPEEDAPAPSD
jgi:hypothetical protein